MGVNCANLFFYDICLDWHLGSGICARGVPWTLQERWTQLDLRWVQHSACRYTFISALTLNSVQSLSHVRLFATPWITAPQASPSITNSRSSLKLTSIESVMPSSHLILCRPCLLMLPIPPSIRVFSNESTLCMRWPKYWSYFSALESFHIFRKARGNPCPL